jgi:3-oxoacyl-[acyl-carrier-protein] synthase II
LPSSHKVVVTGIGLATALGGSLGSFGQALFGGLVPIELLPTRHSQPIPAARVNEDLCTGTSRSERTLGDRSVLLALVASARALLDAGLEQGDPALQRCGLFVGCGSGPTHALDEVYAAVHRNNTMAGLALLRCLPNGAAAALAMRHGLHGSAHTHAGACASSAIAIGEAMRAIRHGYLDRAVVGGAEAPFGDVTVKAWERLRVLAPPGDDPTRACKPFDRRRNGIVLGEGAAFFVLESEAAAAARAAPVHARLLGYGGSCDGRHWTEPCAEGQAQAMRAALADAGLAAADIHAINAHGTGTVVGDNTEAASIARVFGNGADAPWVSSTKPLHGHTLGASGAIELAACIAALKQAKVPATCNLEQPDRALPVHCVVGEPRELPAGANMLSNSFAFGGSNACLVVTGGRCAA